MKLQNLIDTLSPFNPHPLVFLVARDKKLAEERDEDKDVWNLAGPRPLLNGTLDYKLSNVKLGDIREALGKEYKNAPIGSGPVYFLLVMNQRRRLDGRAVRDEDKDVWNLTAPVTVPDVPYFSWAADLPVGPRV